MYLMNVPPVAATETEWRRCGTPGGYSLPVCFNDSDTELSTRGTPISNKVQMIIESLRSSQSSLEMGDEIEANMLSGQERHTQVCKAAVGNYVAAKLKTKRPTESPHVRFSSTTNHDSSDSDSDDSVDRGIEEAIMEYLKEKDGHKRKAETSSTSYQSSKIPRKSPLPFEFAKQHSEGNSSFISSRKFPVSVKSETPTTAAAIPLKKYIQNKASRDENIEVDKSSANSLLSSEEQWKSPSETMRFFNSTLTYPVMPKMEEDLSDSSSDDGIEEAIQRYQLEKNEQSKREAFHPQTFQEDSDSTSDDGIEEAIRSYQLEQQKENSPQRQLFCNLKAPIKLAVHATGSTNSDDVKKNKLKRKKFKPGKQTQALFVSKPKTSLSFNPKVKGNGLPSSKAETKEQSAPAPSKVNTTAELMCAEAILDISKTVMPGAFHQGVALGTCAPAQPSTMSSLPDRHRYEESNDSSIDSEDGIEQEIKKFLEQKAQMHKQTPAVEEPCGVVDPEKGKGKDAATQQKSQRLSLTQKRKQKEKSVTVANMSGADDKCKETNEHARESNALTLPQRSQPQPSTALHQADQSGDKSSSLDSDEDLDTAIKDLLKTKKKSKKKVKDMKKKHRKSIKDEEPLMENALPNRKFKHEPGSKCSALKKVHGGDDDVKDKCGFSKNNVSQQKQMDTCKEGDTADIVGRERHDAKSLQTVESLYQTDDESSSVDSDDSIEQEIRRFLAEKAKVSTGDKGKDGALCRNDSPVVQDSEVQFPLKDFKQETQQAEISPKHISSVSASPVGTQQRFYPEISSTSPQSRGSSVQSCSPSLLEPADGAGAMKNQQRRPNTARDGLINGSQQADRGRPASSPNYARSLAESIKWRQSLGLPIPDPRALSRTPFHITSSERRDTSSDNRDLKSQTPAAAWCSSGSSRAPFSASTETGANVTARPPVLKFFSAARQHSKMTFTQSLTPGNRSQFSMEEGRASTVHVPKDKSVFVELETNRTNHVQVQSRERSEGKEKADSLRERKREGKSMKMDDEGADQDREDEEFIDESDCESDSRRDPDKMQGFPALSLSREIDSGLTISPCIALTSEERTKVSNWKLLVRKCMKGNRLLTCSSEHTAALQHVKRKLCFVPVSLPAALSPVKIRIYKNAPKCLFLFFLCRRKEAGNSI
ncbi:protein phosphatase 1 regulatory subunit 26 isoform X1 [Poecilia reticulata]|uniref:Protein phosphatase 1 regulatory subunit 26 n=1 Tax=Poecilia reticulata TaxID=8081 RepID=A0A3P9QCD3_POERE|nr:PREDICTED: protein phosphatase 1 regulatory subunit 26 isoform X1 [Poecilia reticulata]